MNLLFVGAGLDSWHIRGEELGAAMGARVRTHPSSEDWRWADLGILVKRAGLRQAVHAHQNGVPIVWDPVDCWQQPQQNRLDPERACGMMRQQIAAIQPLTVIGSTRAMAEACDGVYLAHHARPNIVMAPVREQMSVVAYDGNAIYLGTWKARLEQICSQRGWRFVVNPPQLSDADVIIALRQGPWDGWMCRQWKSGVKLVNAMAAGRPVITQTTAAFAELQPVGTVIERADDLVPALEAWVPADARATAFNQASVADLALARVADQYRTLLASVREPCPAA